MVYTYTNEQKRLGEYFLEPFKQGSYPTAKEMAQETA